MQTMESNQRERHEEFKEMFKKQEDAMNEHTQVIKEMDIFKSFELS